jgi:hypothetical protein
LQAEEGQARHHSCALGPPGDWCSGSCSSRHIHW